MLKELVEPIIEAVGECFFREPARGGTNGQVRLSQLLKFFNRGVFANQMVDEGLIDDPPWIQLCTGIPYGMPNDPGLLASLTRLLPANAQFTTFGISAMQMPWVAQAILLDGHVRVGLEDNLYLDRGVFATNAQLVERARQIIESMGARVQSNDQARETLGLS